jgi:hypothetical protein
MTRLHGFAAAALAITGVVILAEDAAASGTPKWSLEQLAGFADVVVVARVDALSPAWDADTNGIYTFVTIRVERVLKGSVPHRQIVVKQLGGRVGRIGLHVSDQADFHVGETVLLFLEVRPRDGTLYTSALWQGKWNVDVDGRGERMATRREPAHGEMSDRDRQPLATIERSLARRKLMASRREMPIEFVPVGNQFAPAGAAASSTYSFTVLGPLRYQFSPPVDMQRGGQPGLAGGGSREILSAINKWNNAGALFRYGMGSADAAPRCTTEELGNGRVTITFMDPCHEMSDTGGTLAIGGSYYLFGGAGSVDATEFNRATEGFIVTNDGPTALEYLTRSGCFEDVQTHELGHVLGLGHSLDPTAIMFPTINSGCPETPRSLGEDDIAGITYIYGFRTSTRSTAPLTSPTNVRVDVNGVVSVTVSWGAVEALSNSDTAAATNYRVDFRRGHEDSGPVLATFTTTTTTLTVAIPPGVVGDFNVVIMPANMDGGGPPSFRKDFTICGAMPAAVMNLAGAVVDGIARVSWQPSAGATSYRVQVGSTPGAADLYPATELGFTTIIQGPVGPDFQAWVRIVAVSSCGVSPPADVFLTAHD